MSGNDVTANDYREKLIKLISNVDNVKYMEYIYRFAKAFGERWGVL